MFGSSSSGSGAAQRVRAWRSGVQDRVSKAFADRSRRRRLVLAAGVWTLLAIAVAVFSFLFSWDWFKAPLAGYLSVRAQRQVRILGHLADPLDKLLVPCRRRFEARNGRVGGHERVSLTDFRPGAFEKIRPPVFARPNPCNGAKRQAGGPASTSAPIKNDDSSLRRSLLRRSGARRARS